MKRFNELTTEELVVMNDSEIETLIDLEVAHAGILPVLPPKPKELPLVDIKPTIEVFEIDNVIFTRMEDAAAFQKMERRKTEYNYSSTGTNYMWLRPVEESFQNSIQAKKYYTEADVMRVRQALIHKKEIENENLAAKTEYEKFLKDTNDIREEVHGAYRDAVRLTEKRVQAEKIYSKHLELADGNAAIAEKFFRDAYKSEPEIVEYTLKRRGEPCQNS